jgi:hypothetical protein
VLDARSPQRRRMVIGAGGLVLLLMCPGATAAHGELPGNPVVLAALGSVRGVEMPQPPTAVAC